MAVSDLTGVWKSRAECLTISTDYGKYNNYPAPTTKPTPTPTPISYGK